MTKDKTQINEYPINLAGEEQWVKKGIFSKQIAEQCSIKFKSEIKKADVETMLEALDIGKTELSSENSDEFHKTFEIVKEAYDSAVERVEQSEAEEQRKKHEAEEAESAKEAAAEKMFLAVKDETASFTDLVKDFDTGEMDRFIPKKGVDTKKLLVAVNSAARMGDFTNWMKGDLIVELENRGELKVVTKLVEATGQPFSNFYNAAKTCRAVPPDKRHGAKYTIFAEIANAKFSKEPAENQKTLMDLVEKATKGEFTAQTARAAVQEAKGKTPPSKLALEDNTKAEFLIFDEGTGTVNVATGFPKELIAQGITVVDPKTLRSFTSFKAKPENRWVDLPLYKKPEEEKEVEKLKSTKNDKNDKKAPAKKYAVKKK